MNESEIIETLGTQDDVLMDQPPVRLCCGQRHLGAECPDGLVMCCLCFDRFTKDNLHIDESGARIDVCVECHAAEQSVIRDG